MSLVVLVPLILLGLYLVPVYVLRRQTYPRAQDFVVASEHTPPGVIQNSLIGYALKMATFGPFFAWGASGNVWPAIIAALCFALGLCVLYVLRRPLLAFLAEALGRGQSITVHEFVARQHGNDPRVRLLAASLTILALAGLAVAEALALAAVLKAILPDHAIFIHLMIAGVLIVMLLLAVLAGNSGVMRAGQTQLGMIYLGLFGAAAFLLYLQISALGAVPSFGTLAIAWTALFCLVLVGYRRSRYVDTSPVTAAGQSDERRKSKGVGAFRKFERLLNVAVSFLAVLAAVLAFMQLSSEGVAAAVRESLTALQTAPRLPALALAALVLLPLFYPLVDITNWQRIAAFESGAIEAAQRPAALRRLFRIYAVESPLMWIFICMLGAIAAVATAITGNASDVIAAVIQKLDAQHNFIAGCAIALLLIGAFAMAFSMLGSAFSAGLCTIRYDILPVLRPATELAQADETTARQRTIQAAALLCLAIVAGYFLAGACLRISVTSSAFLALIFAVCCAQLSFVPLVLAPLAGWTSARGSSMSGGWALAILVTSAAAGLAALIVSCATASEAWLWAAVPACLASGFLLTAIARATSISSHGP